jgi:hypothetical protein
MNAGVLPESEKLARFITFSRWVRSDRTVRPDAFIPHPYPDLSVTRHRDLSESQLWKIGEDVVRFRKPPPSLYGRADVTVGVVHAAMLRVEAQPVPENVNHAGIIGWPSDKPGQKIRAQELAAAAGQLVPNPVLV